MGVKSFDKADPSKKQIEIYQDFSGGINTELADSAMKDNQFRKLVNFDLDAAGSIKKRDGLYRIPFVRQQIEAMFKKKYGVNKGNEIASKIIINDVVEFFDGAHWVFNYITNYGLIVLLLDKTMSLPQDLNLQLFEHVLFYPMSKIDEQDTYNVIGDKVKISPYNDTYIMYATKYSNANGLVNIDEKQIKMFSWNPINDDDQTIGGNVARPQWIEAVDNQDEVETITYYGDTTPYVLESNKLDIIDNLGEVSYQIGERYYGSLGFDELEDFSIIYGFNTTQTWFDVNENGTNKRYFIRTGDGKDIPPTEIATITLEPFCGEYNSSPNIGEKYWNKVKQKIFIYLKHPVKSMTNDEYVNTIKNINDVLVSTNGGYDSRNETHRFPCLRFTYVDVIMFDYNNEKQSGEFIYYIEDEHTPFNCVWYRETYVKSFTNVNNGQHRIFSLHFENNVAIGKVPYIIGGKAINPSASSNLSLDSMGQIIPLIYTKPYVEQIEVSNGLTTLSNYWKYTANSYRKMTNYYDISIYKQNDKYYIIPNSTGNSLQNILDNYESQTRLFNVSISTEPFYVNDLILLSESGPMLKRDITFKINNNGFVDERYYYSDLPNNHSNMFYTKHGSGVWTNTLTLDSTKCWRDYTKIGADFTSISFVHPLALIIVGEGKISAGNIGRAAILNWGVLDSSSNSIGIKWDSWDQLSIQHLYMNSGDLKGVGEVASNPSSSPSTKNLYSTTRFDCSVGSTRWNNTVGNDDYWLQTGSCSFSYKLDSYLNYTNSLCNTNYYYNGVFSPATAGYVVGIQDNASPTSFNVNPMKHGKNIFELYKLTYNNLFSWMDINNVYEHWDLDNFSSSIELFGYELFGDVVFNIDGEHNDFNDIYRYFINDSITSFKLMFNCGNFNKQLNLPYYAINSFFKNLFDINNKQFKIEYIKINDMFYSVVISMNVDNQKLILLQLTTKELQSISFKDSTINMYYNYLPNGVENVLKFQHQQYVKPNLNDLNYLSYNLNLFSRFNQSRFPSIYNKDIHHNISSDLVKYPKLDITQQNNYIQLFGIFPVNDIILEPNKQKFQLFYSLQQGIHPEDLIIAKTTMTVADYNQMVNSKDYSTTGYTSNTENTGETKCIGPNWTPFNTFFSDDVNTSYNDSLDDDNPPKPAIFTVDVPDTTEPYLILIQVAQRDDKYKGENVPKLATVVETRIQMSPNTSYRDRLDIVSLFDEYTATNNLTTYSTNLIAYGQTNKLYFSDNAIPSYFPLTRAIQLKTPEAIKKCSLFQNKLIVSTENTKNFISGSSFDSENDPFILSSISTDTGLIAPKSEVPVGDLLFFLDKGGVKYLKNVAASYYKEFSYKQADEIIKSIVPIDKDACGISYNDKYYLCFPNNRIMLIFNTTFRCWTMYQSEYLDFAKMFVNDGELYGISRNTFNIFKFDKNVYVDNWNELEDDEIYIDNSGYETISNANGEKIKVQKGTPIMCIMETKNLDQNYLHRKKYSWALLSTHTYNKDDDSMYVASNSSLKPYVLLDENLINYTFDSYDKVNNTIIYNQDKTSPYDILVRDDSALNVSAMVDYQKLGYNNTNSYFNIPIRRKGNSIAFGFTFKEPCGLIINSLSIKYGLQDIKRNKGGKS